VRAEGGYGDMESNRKKLERLLEGGKWKIENGKYRIKLKTKEGFL